MKLIKFFILLSVVLFAGLFFASKSTQAQTGCGSEYGSSAELRQYPTSMQAGSSAQVIIVMTNCGTMTWTEAKQFKLGSQNPESNKTWGLARVYLYQSTSPVVHNGDSTAFYFNITAPSGPGTYNFQWRMLRENVRWFGDYTPNVQIQVTKPIEDVAVNVLVRRASGGSYADSLNLSYNETSIPLRIIYHVSDAASCWATGSWSGSKHNYTDSDPVTGPSSPGTYSYGVACIGLNGSSASDSATVNLEAPLAPPSVSISANPTSVVSGGSSTITWSSSNATSCTVSPTDWTGINGSQSTGALSAATTYTASCTGSGGSSSESATVSILSPASATCTSAGPDDDVVAITATTRYAYAYGVSGASQVLFPTWTQVNGQDDMIWYQGTNQGSGTWRATIDPSNHSGAGLVFVHAYPSNGFSNVFCDSANFYKEQMGTVRINIDTGVHWVLTGPNGYSSQGTGSTVLNNLRFGVYTLTPDNRPGYVVSVTPSNSIELK
jgi:hypothetical protein